MLSLQHDHDGKPLILLVAFDQAPAEACMLQLRLDSKRVLTFDVRHTLSSYAEDNGDFSGYMAATVPDIKPGPHHVTVVHRRSGMCVRARARVCL